MIERKCQKSMQPTRKQQSGSMKIATVKTHKKRNSMQNIETSLQKKSIDPIFQKRTPVYITDFAEVSSAQIPEQNSNRRNKIISCRSNPNLLSFSNYIKLEKPSNQILEKYATSFQEGIQQSQVRSLQAKYDKKKPNEQNNMNKQVCINKPQRFVRKRIQTDLKSINRNQSEHMYNQSKRILNNLAEKLLAEKDSKQKQLQKELKHMNLNKLKMQKQLKEMAQQLEKTRKVVQQKNKDLKNLQKELELLLQENKLLLKRIQQLQFDGQSSLLKGVMWNPSQLSCENLNSDTSMIPFDMTETAQYISNISDLEEEIMRSNKQIFQLNKKIEQYKIKEHCNNLMHKKQIDHIQDQWKQKFIGLNEKYRVIKSELTDLKQERSCSTLGMKKNKSKQHPQEVHNQIEKSSFFNLSMSIQ